jgi:hypothetical protein
LRCGVGAGQREGRRDVVRLVEGQGDRGLAAGAGRRRAGPARAVAGRGRQGTTPREGNDLPEDAGADRVDRPAIIGGRGGKSGVAA